MTRPRTPRYRVRLRGVSSARGHIHLWTVERDTLGVWKTVGYFDSWREAFNNAEMLALAGRRRD